MKNKFKVLIIFFLALALLFGIGCATHGMENNNKDIENIEMETADKSTISPHTGDAESTTTKPTQTESENTIKTQDTTSNVTTTTTTTTKKEPYYTNIYAAINDLSNKTIQNADASKDNASVELNLAKSEIILKKTITLNQDVNIATNCSLNLNGKTITFASKNYINVCKNVNFNITDTVGNGTIKKDETLPETTYFIVNNGNLTINNGIYNINSSQKGAVILILNQNGSININNGNFNINALNAKTYMLKADDGQNITINNGTFNIKTDSGRANIIKTYPPITNEKMNIRINGGNYTINSNSGTVKGFDLKRGNQLYINNCFVDVRTVKCSDMIDTAATALELYDFDDICIDGGKFIAIQSDKTTDLNSLALKEARNKKCVINGGAFYGYSSAIYSSTTINNGVFSGIHSGLEFYGDTTVTINGGTFESPWHGGLYVCNKETYINNATLGAPKWSESYFGKETNFKPQYEDGSYWNGTLYSCIYIGGPDRDVTAYMNNCEFQYTQNLTTEYSVVLTSNYGHKNSSLHISNTDAVKKIRVDGTNESGNQGHLYIKENVKYNGIFGTGFVESKKY